MMLDPVLDLAAARRLREQLLAALQEGEGPLALDGASVERIGTPAVQVLLAAAESFAQADRALTIAPSPALAAAFADLGLAPLLDALEPAP